MRSLLSLPDAFEGLRRRNTLTLPDARLIFGRRLHQYRRRRAWHRRCHLRPQVIFMAPGDVLPDTQNLSRGWCPGCEPDVDPSRDIVELRHCALHPAPSCAGLNDAGALVSGAYLSSAGEARGAENRALCDLLHRGKGPSSPDSAAAPVLA